MTQQPTCPSCGGAFITPPLQLNASGYSVHVSVEKADGGFLANNIAVYLSARICASCGLASLVAPPEELRKLAMNWNNIKWPGA